MTGLSDKNIIDIVKTMKRNATNITNIKNVLSKLRNRITVNQFNIAKFDDLKEIPELCYYVNSLYK